MVEHVPILSNQSEIRLGKKLFGDLSWTHFCQRFEEEVGDDVLSPPAGLRVVHIEATDRYSLYETAERTAEREHLSRWADFSRGCWREGDPLKAGLYPVRDRSGHRGRDREITALDEGDGAITLIDTSGGYVGPGKVTEWVGSWWSEPYPPLPGAK